MNLENLNHELENIGIYELQGVIREFNYYNTMDVRYLLNYPEENEMTVELLADK